ncbi:MBL fold metallo-hydrolase [Streptomyces phaeochromogenes]|uniref:MBL fold metallo-hydrolase n=1 Tax=Streptomyces phaeochromogenes TaxID=1923 RepID=UPI003864EC23|nr:MBL fold metallo-hydrolase [Streptomyces phaeochromogenes]
MSVTWEEAGWEELGPRVGRCRLPVWDCTAGLVVGEGAALMIDAGSGLREGARLRTEARRLLGGGRVTHLALTHAHFDHVFGAAAFAGVEIFGAAGLERVLADGRDELRADAERNGADPGEAAEAADLLVRPQHLVSGEWALDLGGGVRVLLANVGPGHTGHDLAVLVRSDLGDPGGADGPRTGSPEIVFCGDLVEESGEPQAGPDAVPTRWPAALDRLLALGGEDAVYVPGHGAAVDAGFVRAQRDALARRFGVS